MSKTQTQVLLSHLKQGRKITSKSAWELFGISSLQRRLSDLREKGHTILDTWQTVPNRHGDEVRIKVYTLQRNK